MDLTVDAIDENDVGMCVGDVEVGRFVGKEEFFVGDSVLGNSVGNFVGVTVSTLENMKRISN